jgi:hypothetical protein
MTSLSCPRGRVFTGIFCGLWLEERTEPCPSPSGLSVSWAAVICPEHHTLGAGGIDPRGPQHSRPSQPSAAA